MEIKANKKSPNFAEHSLSFPLWIHSLSFFCQKSMMELSLSLFCWHTIGGPERVAERERERVHALARNGGIKSPSICGLLHPPTSMRTTTNHSRLFCLAGRQAHYERGRPPLSFTTSSNHSLFSFVVLCVGDEKSSSGTHTKTFSFFAQSGCAFFCCTWKKKLQSSARNLQVREIAFLSAKNPFLFLTADFDPSHPHPPLLVSPRLPSPLWHHHHLLGSWLGQV